MEEENSENYVIITLKDDSILTESNMQMAIVGSNYTSRLGYFIRYKLSIPSDIKHMVTSYHPVDHSKDWLVIIIIRPDNGNEKSGVTSESIGRSESPFCIKCDIDSDIMEQQGGVTIEITCRNCVPLWISK